MSHDDKSRRVREYELIRTNDGGEVRIWADGQIDVLKDSHMTVGFREAAKRQSLPSARASLDLHGLLGNVIDHWERVPNDIKSDPGMENLNRVIRAADAALASSSTERAITDPLPLERLKTEAERLIPYITGSRDAEQLSDASASLRRIVQQAHDLGASRSMPNAEAVQIAERIVAAGPADEPDAEWSKGAFDIEGYIAALPWSAEVTDREKTLVGANLRALFSTLKPIHNSFIREARAVAEAFLSHGKDRT